jgi:flagellar biosynthetic protein FliQ
MNLDDFLLLGQNAIVTAVLVSSPILVLGLVAGLAVSIFQAATQINDAALAFIPKILSAVVGLVFFGHFMIVRIATFTQTAYERIGHLGPNG